MLLIADGLYIVIYDLIPCFSRYDYYSFIVSGEQQNFSDTPSQRSADVNFSITSTFYWYSTPGTRSLSSIRLMSEPSVQSKVVTFGHVKNDDIRGTELRLKINNILFMISSSVQTLIDSSVPISSSPYSCLPKDTQR